MCERVSEVVGVEKKGIHILTREKELILKQSNSEPNSKLVGVYMILVYQLHFRNLLDSHYTYHCNSYSCNPVLFLLQMLINISL